MATVQVLTKAAALDLEANPTHNHDTMYNKKSEIGATIESKIVSTLAEGDGISLDYDSTLHVVTVTATAAVGLAQSRVFKWADTNFATVASEPIYLPQPCQLSLGPVGTLAPESGNANAIFTIETAPSPTGPWTERYGGTKPTIPTGQTYVIASPPTTQDVATPMWLRVRPTALPSGPTAGGSAVTQPVAATTYNSLTSSLGTHPGPTRPAGATGDVVMMFISYNGAYTVTLDADWSVVGFNISNATTPRAGMMVVTAPWTSTLNMDITTSTASPVLASAVILRGASASTPVADSNIPIGGNATTSDDNTTPTGTATAAADLVYFFGGFWHASGVDGYHITPSGGPGTITEIADEVTTRSAVTNFGLWVGRTGAIALGATFTPCTLLFAGGTGSTATSGYVTGYVSIKRASGTTGPTSLTVQVFYTGS